MLGAGKCVAPPIPPLLRLSDQEMNVGGTGTHRFYVELVPHLHEALLGEGRDVSDCDHDGSADPLAAHALGIRFDGLHAHLLILRVEHEDLLMTHWLKPDDMLVMEGRGGYCCGQMFALEEGLWLTVCLCMDLLFEKDCSPPLGGRRQTSGGCLS